MTQRQRRSAGQVSDDDVRTGLSVASIKRAFSDNLFYCQAKFPEVATRNDYYLALAYTVRDRLLRRWINTARTYLEKRSRTVVYLSAEYLLGPHLGVNLINLGIYDQVRQAVEELGLDLDELLEQEEEPGLGNGGLGRLAACFMDSLATLEIPAIGYGIRYEFGIFDQLIRDGWQAEITDKWLRFGNPWEVPRPEISYRVRFGGNTVPYRDHDGNYRVRWQAGRVVKGIPYDTPVLGYAVNTANLLRLWQAAACESFDFQAFNEGDYYGAVDEKVISENLTKVLYPNDEPVAGQELRLAQQYFFVSCSLQDMIRLYLQKEKRLERLHQKFAVQLNDTHPSIGVAELMRLLVDERRVPWDRAWDITRKTFSYTNHTLLPEALEKWPVQLFKRLLPRHLEIVYEINKRFLAGVRVRHPGDLDRVARLSLIEETGDRYVRMANLACVGSHAINGVARLHTELLKKDVLHDFHELWPRKFSNKTNGVTPRRFVVLSNPRLTELITSRIGDGWIRDLERLRDLEGLADDPEFQQLWGEVKLANKKRLADVIRRRAGVKVNPRSMFDVQVKRLHEYKRQHLNVLHIVRRYLDIKNGVASRPPPRTFVFAGKAAPGYDLAKLMIKFINSVGAIVNGDPDTAGLIKVVFLPDFNVKNAQPIYPAADLSEQISTAGKEASGTGNMKFSLNGALTIGTLDGANIEIREAVGAENFFLFGLTAAEVYQLRAEGHNPWRLYRENEGLREVIDLIASGFFSLGDRAFFRPLIDSLLYRDEFMLLPDYQSYVECQATVDETYRHPAEWVRKSILNVSRMGRFSSDRAIREYCEDIWRVQPVPIALEDLACCHGKGK